MMLFPSKEHPNLLYAVTSRHADIALDIGSNSRLKVFMGVSEDPLSQDLLNILPSFLWSY